jgi:hypothetical protein
MSSAPELSFVYCDDSDVEAIFSQIGVNLRYDTEKDQPTKIAMFLQGRSWGASRINDFAAGRYDPDQLAQSWTVNWWNTVLASRIVAVHRCNPMPQALKDMYAEVMGDLRDFRSGLYKLGDVDLRIVDSPAWSNVRVPVWYMVHRIRVERQLSEKTPRRIVPDLDRLSEFTPGEP